MDWVNLQGPPTPLAPLPSLWDDDMEVDEQPDPFKTPVSKRSRVDVDAIPSVVKTWGTTPWKWRRDLPCLGLTDFRYLYEKNKLTWGEHMERVNGLRGRKRKYSEVDGRLSALPY